VAIIMSSTPSSRRRTTWCFLCIESDGIVGKSSARQQDVRDGINQYTDANDKVLVVKSAGAAAWRNLGTELDDWLKKHVQLDG
jgi:hypothetical protein